MAIELLHEGMTITTTQDDLRLGESAGARSAGPALDPWAPTGVEWLAQADDDDEDEFDAFDDDDDDEDDDFDEFGDDGYEDDDDLDDMDDDDDL